MRAPLCCGHCRGAGAIRSKQAGLGGIRRLGAAVGTVVVAVGTAVVAVGYKLIILDGCFSHLLK